jgi:DNA-nicking Smr family endonuclease
LAKPDRQGGAGTTASPPRRVRLTDQDRNDWAQFARHIELLPGRRLPTVDQSVPGPSDPIAPAMRHPALPPMPRPTPARATPLTVGQHPGGLDTSTWNRFRAGKLAPARTLDLHGRTAQHAFHALHGFLHAAHADRLRCVEVITGRGSGDTGGVIRRELPVWLNLPALRPLVLAASHPHAANPGSVRLLLRRPK